MKHCMTSAGWLALLLATALHLPGNARASGLVVCDNCVNPRQIAAATGPGPTLVVDLAQVRLHGFDVEYDRELQRYRAMTTAVPSPVSSAFQRIMALANLDASTRAGGNGAVVPVHPDNPGAANGIVFPEAFKDHRAYDIVQSATARARLESSIGAAFSGATTQSTAWNSISITLSSVGLGFVSRLFGVESVTYAITWRDGSQTHLVLEPDSVHQARYVRGRSRDAQGNPIPDAAATGPEAGDIFAGDHGFPDAHAMREWVHTAKLYGVQVDDARYDTLRLRCTWNGETLACSSG
ncbi:hypothetical protein ACLB90_02185 [Stenotrophomonas sp. LGBM10]|uniref:hypothetical protein n=1 Tax=Stenotrophomonas sp. LGBM10 TaxID=3390038 RepID=UPI00398AB831